MFFHIASKESLPSETTTTFMAPSDGGSLGGFGFEGEVTSFGGTLGRMNGVAAMAAINQHPYITQPTMCFFSLLN